MTTVATKAESLKHSSRANMEYYPEPKKKRTLEDFNTFCSLILAYEARQEELKRKNKSSNSEDSVSSSTDSAYSEIASSPSSSHGEREERLLDDVDEEYDSDDEAWDVTTCYCSKPFAGRPMIECSECLTWIHLSCAKIRRSNVPETFVCQKCKDAKHTIRRSNRVRTHSKTRGGTAEL